MVNGNGSTTPSSTFGLEGPIGSTNGQAFGINGTLTYSAWSFVAVSYASGDGGPRCYVGTQSTPVAQVTYTTISGWGRQDVVTPSTDDTQSGRIGNRAGVDRTFDGRIEHTSMWDQVLSTDQLDVLRLRPYAPFHRFATSGGTVINLKGYYPLTESAAATCLDHSGNGNNGTVTGTTVGASAPYLWTRRGPQATIWTPAAAQAAAGVRGAMYPRMQRHIHQRWSVPRVG